MNDFPTLENDRLLLREFAAADAPDLFAVHGDGEARRWFGNDPLTGVRQAERLIETRACWRRMPKSGLHLRWAIERKAGCAKRGCGTADSMTSRSSPCCGGSSRPARRAFADIQEQR